MGKQSIIDLYSASVESFLDVEQRWRIDQRLRRLEIAIVVTMADHSDPRVEYQASSISSLPKLEQSGPPLAKATRSYRACTNCRAHKTKCDLGDVNNPISPPCSRCKRERKICEFAESRRGGRANIEAGLAKRKGNSGNGESFSANNAKQEGNLGPGDGRPGSFSPGPGRREREQDRNPLEPVAFTRQPIVSRILQSTEGEVEGRNPHFMAYNDHPPYNPVPDSAPTALHRPQFSSLLPGVNRHAHAGHQGFPIQMESIGMSFVHNVDHHSQSTGSSTAALPTNAFTENQIIRSTPTGPAFAEFFTTPNTASNNRIRRGSSGGRQNGITPQDSPGEPETHASISKTRRLSSSTTDSFKRDRDAKNEKLALEDTRSFVINAGMHNESDALQILAMAAETRNTKKRKRDSSVQATSPDEQAKQQDSGQDPSNSNGHHEVISEWNGDAGDAGRRRSSAFHHNAESVASRVTFRESNSGKEDSPALPDITQFYLVEQGIVDPEQVHSLCRTFFERHHHYFPLVPSKRIPRTIEDINAFAIQEPYLMTACIIIASKCQTSHSARRIHEQTWNIMKGILAEVNFQGTAPTIGLVEGLLLIAENLPREKSVTSPASGEDRPVKKLPLVSTTSEEQKQVISGAENRQAWMLIGSAIRMAYGLGLDQLARQMDGGTEARHRATIAWTYCYIFDRQISIRTGRAFWSRGPALCFRGYSHVEQTGPAGGRENFPLLCDSDLADKDQGNAHDQANAMGKESGELLQAYVELTQNCLCTQSMTNVHDVFYPSETRTHTLVKAGEYFIRSNELALKEQSKQFNNSLESFKITWSRKSWAHFPHGALVWAMFHYTRLYSSSFAFQAHITRSAERAQTRSSHVSSANIPVDTQPAVFFPRSSAFTPDALYIYEAINAGRELLGICINELYPEDVLQYLPSRYLLWFQYAAVFLLKAVYSGAMVQSDHVATLVLVERLCNCLVTCSKDSGHPAARYGHLIRALSSRLLAQSSSAAPSRAVSPELQKTSADGGTSWGFRPTAMQTHQEMRNGSLGMQDPLMAQPATLAPLFPGGGLGEQGRFGDSDNMRTSAGLFNQSTTEAEQNELLRWLLEEPAAQTTLLDYNFDIG
ncbi:hypothetical protein NliqN6_1931 [Naganishia liquefaciens]|uniref:Zn(2)-C6 fungal-type domain-containing protein n=1 Tax=Naganishia liquefaciens TaxID=104408 RepID=A0A8H3TRA2_9TREE|nr:hypothetical protein NliqN6_1931 [Naganishia liquefaciens]